MDTWRRGCHPPATSSVQLSWNPLKSDLLGFQDFFLSGIGVWTQNFSLASQALQSLLSFLGEFRANAMLAGKVGKPSQACLL
jgi:hypothetical protein